MRDRRARIAASFGDTHGMKLYFAGIDEAEALVAVMDGPDPDSGTCWEVGYAHGTKKPIVLVRTDFRSMAGVPANTTRC
jgi:nucleoside 2-deoxyribosyltransferase